MGKKTNATLIGGAAVLLAAVVFAVLLLAWRFGLFDPWLHANFPHAYPVALGLIALLLAWKLAFRPSERDLERDFRWLWVLLLLVAFVVLFFDGAGAAQTREPSHLGLRDELLQLDRLDQEVRAPEHVIVGSEMDVDARNTGRLKEIIAQDRSVLLWYNVSTRPRTTRCSRSLAKTRLNGWR